MTGERQPREFDREEFERLLEASSLGTPEAKAIRARARPGAAEMIVAIAMIRVNGITPEDIIGDDKSTDS